MLDCSCFRLGVAEGEELASNPLQFFLSDLAVFTHPLPDDFQGFLMLVVKL